MRKYIKCLSVTAFNRIRELLPEGWLYDYDEKADEEVLTVELSHECALHSVGYDVYLIYKDSVAKLERQDFGRIQIF